MRKKVVFRCEACESSLIKRTSVLTHRYLRQDTYVCENPVCGATYSGHSELTGIASPSGMPSAHVELPPTSAYQRALALRAFRESKPDQKIDLPSSNAKPAPSNR